MTDALNPQDEKQILDAVKWALAEGKRLEVVGRGSKRALGRPSQSDLTLDISALSAVTLYEPEELVLSAKAATPLAEIEALVDGKNQQLAFEPMDLGPLLGGEVGGTIGGALAAGLAGPRRIKAGSARDHFLGFSAVSGRGEIFKSGGRVVKNVTGYDLCKLLAGSFGTLAAMTDVTVKVLPKPETEETLLLSGLDDARAVQAMTAAMASSCDVSGAAHLPAHVALRFSGIGGSSTTAFRLEGVVPSVRHRRDALAALLKPYGAVVSLEEKASRALWPEIRDVRPFAAAGPSGDRPVWRVSLPPARGFEIAALIEPSAQMFYDWAGGLIWIAPLPGGDAGAAMVRKAIVALGGHATLVRAPAAVRAAVDVFEPQLAPVAALTKRVKESFDPKGVLNPGRMWAGV
jgi:glycolate oxidase FAD binding subunit